MEDVWKATIKLNECYRASESKPSAEESCKQYYDNLTELLNSKAAEPDSILKNFWINYHSKLLLTS
jgi:hypothetical protein